MPSTFIGLVVFSLLVTPGLLYELIAERGVRPRRRHSAFRELATIAVVSIFANLAATLVVLAPNLWGQTSLDFDALVDSPNSYWRDEYARVIATGLGCFLIACLFAVFTAALGNAQRTMYWLSAQSAPRPTWWDALIHPMRADAMSGWWKMFFHPPKAHLAKRVSCTLNDGTRVEGWVWAFNQEEAEGPDRDLVLSAPLRFQDVDGVIRDSPEGAITISARNIVLTHVVYQAHGGS